MIKIFRFMRRRDALFAIICLALIVGQVWLDLKSPEYMKKVTELTQTPGTKLGDIIPSAVMMLLCTFSGAVSAVIVGFFSSQIAATFSRTLRSKIFAKVESFSAEEMNRFSNDSLITRTTNDVTQVQMMITMGLSIVIRAPVMAVWAVTKITGMATEWTYATVIALGIMIVMVSFLLVFVMPRFRRMQTLTDNINRVTRENLTGLRVVRAYNADSYEESKFNAANKELTETQLFTSRAMAIMMPVMMSIMSGLPLAIFWIGAGLIKSAGVADKIPLFADMSIFSSYAMQAIMSFMMVIMIFVLLPRAAVSVKRINEVLDTEPAIKDGGRTAGAPGILGTVEFRNVGFRYPDSQDYILKDISFSANKGETVAFIGATGSGKSTLVNLIPRFYDASEGEVLVDGVNVREYNGEALRNKIGYVSQKAVLFMGTVSDNVAYGDNGKPEAELAGIKKAVSIAQGTDFVESMENTYEADVAQGGTNLSGGQKQRLAIARAICRDPEIYIFDDSFSALDYKTDRILRSALKAETAGVTSLIVAQRIGTIMDADRIIVLDDGRVAGIGTHKELLRSCDLYLQIAKSQLSETELEITEETK